jgi:hypothetical protein
VSIRFLQLAVTISGKLHVCIKHAETMRTLLPHCYLFSCIMYCLRRVREDTRGAWWYLLSAC